MLLPERKGEQAAVSIDSTLQGAVDRKKRWLMAAACAQLAKARLNRKASKSKTHSSLLHSCSDGMSAWCDKQDISGFCQTASLTFTGFSNRTADATKHQNS
jgi:hypothetical protein